MGHVLIFDYLISVVKAVDSSTRATVSQGEGDRWQWRTADAKGGCFGFDLVLDWL